MRFFSAILVLFIAFSSLVSAKFLAKGVKSCQAWNNLAHTKNEQDIQIIPNGNYLVIREHKGQYLVKIDKPTTTQRWIDIDCLEPLKEQNSKSSLVSLLSLSWQNSFCKFHSNRKECRPIYNLAKDHLVLHGLWPQPKSNSYCGVDSSLIQKDKHHQWRALPEPELPQNLKKLMLRYMPGVISGLHRHEWIKHGTCYDSNPAKYFQDAINLTKQVDNSMLGEYLRANIGNRVSLINLRKIFERSFGKNVGKALAMKCKGGFLSEIRINIKGKGSNLKELLKGAPAIRSSCSNALVP